MKFPKVGDKYCNNLSGVHGEIVKVERSTQSVKYKSSNDIISYFSWSIMASDYTKIPLEIEVGSRWLLPNGRLITVSNKDHGMIKYYFGEDYCFTRVQFSKYEHNFLVDCSPFTGNLDDYDNTGIKKKPTCGTREFQFSASVDAQGDQLAPFYTSITTNDGGRFPIYTGHRYLGEPTTKLPTNIEKKPLWKRILRKLV